MKIKVHVKPNADKEKIEKMEEGRYKVWVNKPPEDNKANFAVIDILSDYFNVPTSKISLLAGRTSKIKTFKINEF